MFNKETLVEASYRISSELYKKMPKSKTNRGYVNGYSKAGKIAHDVLKAMMEPVTKQSFCATHHTFPKHNEPCHQCVNDARREWEDAVV
jgi:hypothetical protein